MRIRTIVSAVLMMLVVGSVADAQTGQSRYSRNNSRNNYRNNYRNSQSVMVPAGTFINVRLDSQISTDDSHQGDGWNGTVSENVYAGNTIAIPAGSPIQGVVSSTAQGTHSTKAQMTLSVRQITVNGRLRSMYAETQPIVAGTQRARKLGAVAVGAAAGALVGHTVAKDSHGTLIGGLLGGAAGYGLSRNALRTLVLNPGTVLSFTTSGNNMLARR